MTAEKILSIARAEIGTKESPANSNRVKYNTAYYSREVSGSAYPWCAAFVWWCFQQAGAAELYYGGRKTAYCPALMTYHKGQGQAVQSGYKPGDIVFFNFQGQKNPAHVGICESWDGQYITTIDGNTGAGNDANGGAVLRRRRHKKYIVGAYRPTYEEEISMSEDQVRKLVRDELARIEAESAARPVPDWAKELYADAVTRGITDGSRPMAAATRLEVALMVRAATMLGKQEGAAAEAGDEKSIKEIDGVRCALQSILHGMESEETKNSEGFYCRLVSDGVLEQAYEVLRRYEKLLAGEPLVEQIADDWRKSGKFSEGPKGVI